MQERSEEAFPLEQINPEETMTEAEMAKNSAEFWDKFVGESGKESRKVFLVGVLREKGCREVLDAALGTGTDTISLKKAGFSVSSNEVDREFLMKAEEKAAKEGIKLEVTACDWRDLGKFESGSFDAAVCIGNSLTYLTTREDQLKALAEFYRILRFGGTLMVDERNYQEMLDRREEILADPLNNFQLRHKTDPGRATYSEEGRRGVPTKISDRQVTFSYFDVGANNRFLERVTSLYPFKRGELEGLLKEAGFVKITQYSDFREGFDPKADFYEYVAEK